MIYVRLSRDRDGETSTARQEADCRAYAAAKGWEIIEVYSDIGVSAYSGTARPAFEQMLTDVENGKADMVLVWKLDRFSRSLADFIGTQKRLDAAGIAIASYSDPIDTSTPTGRAMLQIIAVFAELESATIRYRVKNALAAQARAGKPNGGGRRPFGFHADKVTVDEHEADLIREAARRFLDGESLNGICGDWQSRGITSTSGKPWTSGSLSRMLRGERLAGYRSHHDGLGHDGRTLYPAEWEPILEPGIFAQLQEALADSRARANRAAVKRHLLAGILRCGLCGEGLGRATRNRYTCHPRPGRRECGRIGIAAHQAELTTWHAVRARILDDALRHDADQLEQTENADELRAIIETTGETLKDLARDFYVGNPYGRITRQEFFEARQPLEDRLRDAEERLLALQTVTPAPQVPTNPDELDAWWNNPDTTLAERRSLIQKYVAEIPVPFAGKTGNRWNPDRITANIVWAR